MYTLYLTTEVLSEDAEYFHIQWVEAYEAGENTINVLGCRIPVTIHYDGSESFIEIDITHSLGNLSRAFTSIESDVSINDLKSEKYLSVKIGLKKGRNNTILSFFGEGITYFLSWKSKPPKIGRRKS